MEISTVRSAMRSAPPEDGGRVLRTGVTILVLIGVLVGSWAVLIGAVVLLHRAVT